MVLMWFCCRVFLFKQKTAYEMRISDWSSDVCSSDLATVPPLADRADLRQVPLVTIDGADARDFDDAVWAEADPDAENPGGWHLLVAIADVARYVRCDDALAKADRKSVVSGKRL